MESLKLAFEAVGPIFILMMLGYALKSIKMADKKTFDTMNKITFKIFLPVLLFYNIYKTDVMEIFNLKLIIFVLSLVLIICIIGYFLVNAVTDDNVKKGVLLQAVYRSNFVILGVPLVEYICGNNATGLASLLVAIVIPIFNVLAVVTLERFRNGKPDPLVLLKGIITNPLILGCIFGILFFVTDIRLPKVLEKNTSDISGIATPLSLIVLGATFTFSSIKGYAKELWFANLSRLVIVPLIAVISAVFMGFRGEALACILVIFAAPVAVSSFAMSQQMGGDENLAALDVVSTSAFCVVTLFAWIFVLSYLGLF